MMGVSLAMMKLKSHCVMREAAMTRDRTVGVVRGPSLKKRESRMSAFRLTMIG